MPTFRICNLGCKVNRVESDEFADILGSRGWTEAASSDIADADLVVVNTCTVTAAADKKARKAVRQAISASPQAQIIVTGCASAINSDEFASLSNRVRIVPKSDVPTALRELAGRTEAEDAQVHHRTRRAIKIQDGCSNSCTYCIVHIARGPERSVPADKVVQEAVKIASAGVPEIVLAGINLGKYADGATRLSGLLEQLLEKDLPCRYRLSSIEPDDIDEKLIDVIARAEGKVCRHLHLPLQSGSSKVLKEMNRFYTADDFASLAQHMRVRLPQLSLTTDIIVGFPGETHEDFMQTMDLCEQCGFSRVHVFPYSERTGTPAAARKDQVSNNVRTSRALELRKLAQKLRESDLAARRGHTELAVVESPDRALTESYHEVAPPPGAAVGTLVEVRL